MLTDLRSEYELENFDGLSLNKRGGKFDTLCSVAKETQADSLCCQEHNIDSTQAEVKKIIHQTTRQHWQRSRISFSNSPLPFSGFYKPGGTLSMTLNHLTGRVVQQTEDKWGRWVSQTLQGRNGRCLTIINVYQVVNKHITAGSISVAAQQRSLLIQSNDTTHNLITAFRRDLGTEVRAH
jgi:hypothetical protein